MVNLLLNVVDVSHHFEGVMALKNVNFTVDPQSITALIGPNGAGKTTLFNCLTGFYKPQHGKFILSNHTTVARTFQNSRLFNEMTVIENCLVAQHRELNKNLFSGIFNTKAFRLSEKKAIRYAYEWLEQFQLSEQANQLAGELPYGKQRHLEIARAMCMRPQLLCLDEPAAGLNPQETQELSRQIVSLRNEHNLTVLLIEHDMSLIMKISDRIVVLDHGEVIAMGPPSVIQQDKKVIKAYLGEE
jgi:branched-chain amino acid transport system ATP-binding protein